MWSNVHDHIWWKVKNLHYRSCMFVRYDKFLEKLWRNKATHFTDSWILIKFDLKSTYRLFLFSFLNHVKIFYTKQCRSGSHHNSTSGHFHIFRIGLRRGLKLVPILLTVKKIAVANQWWSETMMIAFIAPTSAIISNKFYDYKKSV